MIIRVLLLGFRYVFGPRIKARQGRARPFEALGEHVVPLQVL
jgi:hypothetical protein